MPGSENSEYSIELIPAPGYSACQPGANAVESMVDEGNIKIRSTGRVKVSNDKNINDRDSNDYRTVTATFRRAGFLDFLYYTELENQDPAYIQRTKWNGETREVNSSGQAITPARPCQWAADKCNRVWWVPQATRARAAGRCPRGAGSTRTPTTTGPRRGARTWTPTTSAARSPSPPTTR